jgi:nucleoside-diphosphate-sugar epimerase
VADRLGSVILTGASGFVGRHLLESLSSDYRVFAIARRSQYEAAVPEHPNVAWLRADVRDKDSVGRAFREIRAAGGADKLIHLAAYYDFTGGNHENYQETNVTGTRHIIDEALELDLDRFVFASSIAACRFPRLGEALTEASPPDGDYPYAISKRLGEQMVRDVAQRMPSVIVRLGAVYSDWCEYAPLFIFLNTWLSDSWRANILGGRGDSAVPYVHVRDIVSFFRRLLAFEGELEPAEVLQASTNGAVSHTELFELATRHYYGAARKPTKTPRLVAALGLHVLWWLGLVTRNPPFERPWMSRYIDGRLTVDNRKTCERLGWQPHPRHQIERRVPFMVERL